MNTKTTFDYIIVGQGLAGTCLALQFLQNGKRSLVIDKVRENSASRVAAGLFNPITGKNMVKTWMADSLFPYLHSFYSQAEKLTGNRFLYSLPLYKPFISVAEQNGWMGKSIDEDLFEYVDSVFTSPIESNHVKNDFGGLKLKQCGYLDTIKFLESVRTYIEMCGCLLEEDFVEDDLKVESDSVHYHGYSSRKIIFCQGEGALLGKLFSWLPIRLLKGETLTIDTAEKISTIYNRGVYLVPTILKVGATYQLNDTTRTITVGGLKELTEKLDELICFPYEVVHQSWGMRPTTHDRRPILGSHPDYQSVAIFNGLGTKGVSLAPYFSKVLAGWIENGTAMNKEVDIHRYKHYNYAGNLLK